MLSDGTRKLKNAKHGDAVDKYMNTDQVMNTIGNIERKYSIDKNQMDAATIEKLTKQASKE